MNDSLIQTSLYIIVLIFGLHYVVAYAFGWTMHIPGEMLRPGTKPIGRLFVLALGIVMASWAAYSLLK